MRAFAFSAGCLLLAVGACSSKSDTGAGHAGAAGVTATGAVGGAAGSGNASGQGGSGKAGGGGGAGSSATGGMPASGGSGERGGASTAGGASSAGKSSGGGSGNAGSGGTGGTSGASLDGGTGGKGGTAGTGGTTGGAGEAGQGSGGCALNDEFAGTALDPCWQVLNGTGTPIIALDETGGALHLSATGNQNGVWYQGATRSLVYQVVNAPRFKLTTTVHPRKASDASALPTKDLHVGGLMVRDPSSMGGSTENYLFIMLGHSENNNGMVHQGVEFKSTVDGCSDWLEPDFGSAHDGPDADLRICRLGAEFRNYERVPGATSWTLADAPSGNCSGNQVSGGVLTRADLPSTMQVGIALNVSAPSDLDVAFDYVHFAELPAGATADDCTSD